MPPADRTAWERLGRLLAERRTQISPRYANRRAFAADREMNWRTLHDVEAAKRDNFTPQTMRAFEAAYLLAPGSLERTLAGGELEPLPPPPRPELVPSPPPGPLPPGALVRWLADSDDRVIERMVSRDPEVLKKIWELPGPDGRPMAREKRIAMLAVVLADDDPASGEARQGNAGLPSNPSIGGK
jgi:hypothetical protein